MRPEPEVPTYRARFPWLGPMLVRHRRRSPWLGLGADPRLGNPARVCLVPISNKSGRWVIDGPVVATVWRDAARPGSPELALAIARKEAPAWTFDHPADSDWFNLPLPWWVRKHRVEHLAVLLLYPQGRWAVPPSDGPAFLLEPPPPDLHGHEIKGNLPPRAAADPRADHRAAQRRAIHAAINALKRRREALPYGIVELARDVRAGLRLQLGSCQYPPGIVNLAPGYASWRQLGERIGASAPDLVVLAGDQIYADATAGLFDPAQLDDRYRKPYESWLRQRDVRDVVRRVPVIATLDDHEIDENWEPLPHAAPEIRRRSDEHKQQGVAAFRHFLRPPGRRRGQQADALWFDLRHNGIPIFVLDSRTERSPRSAADRRPASLMATGPGAQWDVFTRWLRSGDPGVPKVIVSAAALFPRHRRASAATLAFGRTDHPGHAAWLRSDGWDGFPETFHALLAQIADDQLHRLVFLSGDEHLGLHARATLQGPRGAPVVVHSIHSPGLNAPYRFANSTRADVVTGADRFEFVREGRRYTCQVETEVHEEAGFVSIGLSQGMTQAWQLEVGFPGRPAASPIPL